jgi:TolB protein
MMWRVCTAALLLLQMATAHASLTVHIQQTLEKGLDLAVANFSGPAAGEPLGDIIRNDLRHSPGLRVAEQAVGAWQPGVMEFNEAAPTVTSLTEAEASNEPAPALPKYIVQGFVQQIAPQRYHFSYAVVEPATQRVVLSGQLKAGNGRWRAVAHYISDAVYEKLIGVPGMASRQLAYVQVQQGSRYRLMLADSDGANARTLLQSTQPLLSPSWSPDGKTIAYVSFEDGQSAIYSQNISSGERTRLTALTGTSAAPSWSPDGQRLAMSLSAAGNTDIYIYRLSDGDLQRVTDHAAIDTEPTWAADGNSLLFTSDRSGRAQIYRLDLSSNDAQRVSFTGRFNARAALDPTSDAIVTIHDSGDGRYRVAVLEPRRTPWFLSSGALASSPSFASNGLLLTYTEQTAGGDRVFFVSRDGQLRWQWPERLGTVRSAVWAPK